MAIANTNATNKTQITVDYPDSPNGNVQARLQSKIAISGNEVFQGSDVLTGQIYQCTLDANGNVDATVHTSGWFLPTPDAVGTLAWVYRFTVTDAAGNVRFMARTTVSYSASPQALAAILAAGESSETADGISGLLSSKVDRAGDTMTGQLNFSGTDHAGLKLLSLTTAERDALTPAEGMAIYNETTNQVQAYQGGVWASVGEASAPSLNDITNVTITGTPADKELLAFDTGSVEWINQTAAEAGVEVAGAAAAVQGNLDTHEADTANPHAVTAAQAGADASGTAAAAVSAHEADTTNVHGIADTSALLDTADIGDTVASQSHTHDYVPEDAAILSKTEAYELAAGDEAKIIECNGTFTVTCPNGLDAGFQVAIVNIGTGTITIAAATTLQSKAAAVTIATQYAMAVVYHRGSNVWLLAGDLE